VLFVEFVFELFVLLMVLLLVLLFVVLVLFVILFVAFLQLAPEFPIIYPDLQIKQKFVKKQN